MSQLHRAVAASARPRLLACSACVALPLAMPPSAALSQISPWAQTDAAGTCELHVWPADEMIAVRQRAAESMDASGVLGGIVKRAQEAAASRGDARVASILTAEPEPPLSTTHQIDLIKKSSLGGLLGVTGYRTIVHDIPLKSREIRMVATRYDSSSTAPCYADLVVDDLIYSREYARGRKLKAFLRFRDFGASPLPVRSFATLVETKLELFSLDPPVMTDAATAELRAAFTHNLQVFAAIAAKKVPRFQSPTTTKE